MTLERIKRFKFNWRCILYAIIVAASHNNSEAFATSFRPTHNNNNIARGGATRHNVITNPNFNRKVNGLKVEIVNQGDDDDAIIMTDPSSPTSSATRSNGVVDTLLTTNGNKNNLHHHPDDPVEVKFIAETALPSDFGIDLRLRAYRTKRLPANQFTGNEPCVIYAANKPPFGTDGIMMEGVPVRVHDQCLTSEVFGSRRCDCKEQLLLALDYIAEHGGAVIYLQQEGRGIGLANKIAAYALQDEGMDTVDANLHLGFPEDIRQYGVIPSILKDMRINSIQLITNNPRKVERLETLGVTVEKTIPLVVNNPNEHNLHYLETKQRRMNHKNFGDMLNRQLLPQVNGVMGPKRRSISEAIIDVSTTVASQSGGIAFREGVTASEDGYCFGRKSVEDAISAIARGEMVCVVDDMNRENEGDLIMAADLCTPEMMAKIIRYSSGVICIAMEGERMEELGLPPMLVDNQDPKGTAFSVTVDAAKEKGITTGISARDRSKTVQLLADSTSVARDFSRPGHIFPLRARAGGVLERDGHTEATVDLARLAGRSPCGVLCEIVSEEEPTEMARLPELIKFCETHNLVLTSIVDLQQYRRDTEQ